MDVFDLVATLSLDTSNYEKGLEDAEKRAPSSLKNAQSGFSDATEAAESKTKRFGTVLSTAAKVGAAAVGAASTAMVAFGKQSVSVGKAFDASMSQVAATMGKSMEDMENEIGSVELSWGTFSGNLRDYAKEMGANTAFSATQAADALNYMALAGYNTQESMTQLPNVLNLAAAGGMDLARASDMVTDAQSALGIPMEEMTGFVNKLAKTASSSNTSVSQLGEAILTVGGTAKTLTGGTTELSTALGILADNGVKGAEGGTALRNILLSLTPKSDEAAEAMEAIGMNAYDADGNMRPLADIFRDMNKELSQMSAKERTTTLSSIFNKVDLKSVNALLAASGEMGDRWDELSVAIDQSADAAQKMADTQLDNLSGSMTLFRSALEGAQIAVSDKLSPTLNEFVKIGAEGLSKITNVFSKEGLSPAIDALGEWVSNEVLPTLLDKIPQVISAGSQLIMALVKGIIKNLPKIAQAAVKIVVELSKSITKEIPTLIPAAVDAIIAIAEGLIDNIPLLVDAALKLMVGLAKGLIKALPKIIKKIPEIVEKIVDALLDSIDLIIDAGVELFVALVENLPAIIEGIVEALPKIIAAILNGLAELGGKLANLFTAAWEGIKNVFAPVGEFFAGVWDTITGAFATVGAWFINVFTGAYEGIKNVFTGIGSWFGDRWNDIVNIFTGVGAWFLNVFTQAYNGITSAFKSIGDFFASIWNIITGFFSNAWEKFKEIGTNIVGGLKAGVSGAWNGFVDFFSGLMGGITGIPIKMLKIESPSKVFADIGKFIDLGLAEGIGDNIGVVNDAVEDLADATTDGDYYSDREIVTTTESASVLGGDSVNGMFSVPRNNTPQYINLTVELGGQKVKSVIYQMVQEEQNRIGTKIVRGFA